MQQNWQNNFSLGILKNSFDFVTDSELPTYFTFVWQLISFISPDNLNFQENQRYCYPVRPIPRQHNNKEIIDNHQSHRLTNNNSTTSNLNSAAAIGVVIPTTPNSTALDDNNYNNSNRAQFHHHHTNSSTNQAYHNLNSTGIINNTDSNSNQQNLNIIEGDLTWEQRLNFIQYFLSLNLKPNNKEKVIKIFKYFCLFKLNFRFLLKLNFSFSIIFEIFKFNIN